MVKKSDADSDIDDLSAEILSRVRQPVGRELPFAWIDNRQAAVDELEKHGFPEDLVSAARYLSYRARVKWIRQTGSSAHPALNQLRKRPLIKADKDLQWLAGIVWELTQAARESLAYAEKRPLRLSTAGELLSYLLLWNLAALEIASNDKRAGKRSTSPVRTDSMLSKRTISSLAIDMLENCEVCGYPPGPQLLRLLRALLQADRPKLDQTRLHEAKWVAAWILARDEILTTRQLADQVGVSHGTVSKWCNEPDFKKKIEEERVWVKALKAVGWPPHRPKPEDPSASED